MAEYFALAGSGVGSAAASLGDFAGQHDNIITIGALGVAFLIICLMTFKR